MSVMGPRRCFCCSKVERTTGCVRGMLCDCNQSLDAVCRVCHFCRVHCQCTDAMKAAAIDAKVEYHKALTKITETNLDRVNKRW